jgi:hypothetical protein
MLEYSTVYEISKPPPSWLLQYAGLVPFALGIVIAIGKLRFGWRRPNWLALILLGIFGFMVFTITPGFAPLSGPFTSYQAGRYSVVEGLVTDFHPMPYDGHEEECFSVRPERFCYSDYEGNPGFHNTASHGGPIRAGIHVRIAYSGPIILRIEVGKDEVVSPAQRRQWEINAESESFTYKVRVPLLFLTVFVTLWWNVHWKRTIRQWLRPPIQPITEYSFRILFAVCFLGSFGQLVQHLRFHAFLGQPLIATVSEVAITCGVEAFVLWRYEVRATERNAARE